MRACVSETAWVLSSTYLDPNSSHRIEMIHIWHTVCTDWLSQYCHQFPKYSVVCHLYGEIFREESINYLLIELTWSCIHRKGTGVVDLSPAGDMSSVCTVLRSDGTSLYITRSVLTEVDEFSQHALLAWQKHWSWIIRWIIYKPWHK